MKMTKVGCAMPPANELLGKRLRVFGRVAFALANSIAVLLTTSAHAAIPDAERQALIDIYEATGGSGWLRSGGWFGPPGTECGWDPLYSPDTGWEGVMCTEDESHVLAINLGNNNLIGDFPDVTAFPSLVTLWLLLNPSLSENLPDLSMLSSLEFLSIDQCSFRGPLPLADKLPPNLKKFTADGNFFSGDIPSPLGPETLEWYSVGANPLNGRIVSFNGNPNLVIFRADSAGLIGSIPPLSGLPRLQLFAVMDNKLTGDVPDLSSNRELTDFLAVANNLDGRILSLNGATSLARFSVVHNHLSGSIPDIDNLKNVQYFYVGDNNLTGSLPELPANYSAGAWGVCPNFLNPIASADWDSATGRLPWYQDCPSLPDQIFDDGFEQW